MDFDFSFWYSVKKLENNAIFFFSIFLVNLSHGGMMMSTVPHDILLGRWRLTLDLFGRVFVDDVGLEPGSIISELGGFPVKEAKFRREMEKLRNSRTVDLTLSKLDRDRNNLIVQSFKEFNTHYAQNQRRSSSQPPMVVNRIKVCTIIFFSYCVFFFLVKQYNISKKIFFIF